MARQGTLGKAPRRRNRGVDGDLCRLLRRAVVAARRRSDQSRDGHAMAGGGDRGEYRSRQYRRGGWHPDRACRQDPDRRAYPRYRRQGSRPRRRRDLNEIGLKNGNLIVDDQQRGNKWNFENISLSLRRPSGGGVALQVGEEGSHAWSLRVVVGPAANGVRSVDIRADKVSSTNILLALRLKDLTYSADLPLTGELKGELGRDGLPTYFRGKLTAGTGHIIDTDTPDYPMAIDQAEISVEWDSGRRVLVAPFKIISGSNRITLLAHLEPPNDAISDWQLGLSGGTVVLAAIDPEQPPLIFNRIAIGLRFDTEKRRVLLTQADIGNGEIGIAGTGSVDYSAEPRLALGFAGTPMSASALKRMWPTLIVPEVREWVIERVERGSLQRIEVGVNSPIRNLSRRGPPIPDDGLAVNIVAIGVTLHPVDELPLVRD